MKKNQKGFTLVEVIIAFAVLAIMGMMVCTLYSFLAKMTVSSNQTSDKVDSQKAMYENGTVNADDEKTSNKVTFKTGSDTVTVDIDLNTIQGKSTDNNPNIKYFTKK